MRRSSENFPGVMRPKTGALKPGGGSRGRRALSSLDSNIIIAPKRGALKEKDAGRIKKPTICAHRPVTRSFSAKVAEKGPLQNEVMQFLQQVPHKKQTRDPIAIDVENYSPVNVSAVVQETEATVKEADSMNVELGVEESDGDEQILDIDSCDKENPLTVTVSAVLQETEATVKEADLMNVELGVEESDEDEQILDIDSCDKENPLTVTEYVDVLYEFYRRNECSSCVPPNYMEKQDDINEQMRAILIDWLIEVHHKCELMNETLFLTVKIIDRFLAIQPIIRKKLQLVGLTAMLLACKYEEVSFPVVQDLILLSDNAYTRREVLDMEQVMINSLQFNFSTPTSYVFMQRFLKAAQADTTLELLSFFLIELSLVEYEMLRFAPSLLAASAVFTGQCIKIGQKQWSKTCIKHSQYTQEQLLECAKLMVRFHEKAGTGKLKCVYKKYNVSDKGHVATSEPALFLLDVEL